jgi:uncharacterized protein HemY
MNSSRIDLLKNRVAQNPTNELFRFSLGKELFDEKDYDGATEHLGIALQKKPDWMLVAILLGRCWMEKGDTANARRYFELGKKLAEIQNHEGPLEEVNGLLKQLG